MSTSPSDTTDVQNPGASQNPASGAAPSAPAPASSDATATGATASESPSMEATSTDSPTQANGSAKSPDSATSTDSSNPTGSTISTASIESATSADSSNPTGSTISTASIESAKSTDSSKSTGSTVASNPAGAASSTASPSEAPGTDGDGKGAEGEIGWRRLWKLRGADVIRRFPLALGFFWTACVTLALQVQVQPFSDKTETLLNLLATLFAGAFLSMALSLRREVAGVALPGESTAEKGEQSWADRLLGKDTPCIAVVGILLVISWLGEGLAFSVPPASAAAVAVLTLGMVTLLPFARRGTDDTPLWGVCRDLVKSLIVALLVACVFALAFSLLWFGGQSLFDLDLPKKADGFFLAYLATASCLGLVPFLTLAGLPRYGGGQGGGECAKGCASGDSGASGHSVTLSHVGDFTDAGHSIATCAPSTSIASSDSNHAGDASHSNTTGDSAKPRDGGLDAIRPGGIVVGAVRFLMAPLLCLYILCLYVYAGKIVVTWTLPNGSMTFLLASALIGTVLMGAVVFPCRNGGDGRKVERLLSFWMPWAMVPLMVLWSVGVGRRISDYGSTPSRILLLVFHLWCYGALAFTLAAPGKRIRRSIASFAIALVVATLGPCNAFFVDTLFTRLRLQRAMELVPLEGGESLPMDAERFREFMTRLAQKDPKAYGQLRERLKSDYLSTDPTSSKADATLDESRRVVWTLAPLVDASALKKAAELPLIAYDADGAEVKKALAQEVTHWLGGVSEQEMRQRWCNIRPSGALPELPVHAGLSLDGQWSGGVLLTSIYTYSYPMTWEEGIRLEVRDGRERLVIPLKSLAQFATLHVSSQPEAATPVRGEKGVQMEGVRARVSVAQISEAGTMAGALDRVPEGAELRFDLAPLYAHPGEDVPVFGTCIPAILADETGSARLVVQRLIGSYKDEDVDPETGRCNRLSDFALNAMLMVKTP